MRLPASLTPPALAPFTRSAGCLALVVFVLGCTSRTAGVDPSRAPTAVNLEGIGADQAATAGIALVHRRKCGSCHTRVEPGSLPRATIEAAMARHRRRTKLTDGQWAEMIEFLSHAAPTEPPHTASLP